MRPVFALVAMLAALIPHPCLAGAFGDALAHCLANNTTREDHVKLARFILGSIADNPAVNDMFSVKADLYPKLTDDASNAIVSALSDRCKKEAIDSIKFENGITQGIAALTQAAMQDLFKVSSLTAGIQALGPKVAKDERFLALFKEAKGESQ